MGNAKLPAYRWVILFVISLFAFMGNYAQFQVSVYAVTIMFDLQIDMAGFSMLLLMPMLGSAIFSIPLGVLGDRFGPKKVVIAMACIGTAGAFLRAFTDTFELQLVSMFLLGLSLAAVNANMLKLFSVWFQDKTGFATGIYFAAACLGIVAAQAFGFLFPSVFDAYLSTAVVMGVSVVLWTLLVRNAPAGMKPLPPEPIVQCLGVAARSKGVWLLALAAGFGMAAATAYAGVAPQMLEVGRGVDPSMAGALASIITIGDVFGSLVGPAIYSRTGKAKPYLLVTIIGGAAIMFGNYYAPLGIPMMVALFMNGFITSCVGPVVNALPYSLPEIRSKYAGSAGGIVGTVSLLMSYFIPVGIGAISGSNFELNLGLEAACFLTAALCVIALPELGPKGKIAKEVAALEAADAAAEKQRKTEEGIDAPKAPEATVTSLS